MKILIYGLNFAPELTGIGKYTAEMAYWLADHGHEVLVVTSLPYYPEWRIHDEYRGRSYTIERPARNLTVFRTPLYVPAKPTGLKRVIHLLSFVLSSLPVLTRVAFQKPDVVFTVEPTFFGAPFASLIASATGAASWLHIQDFELDAGFELKLMPFGRLLRGLSNFVQEILMGRFARVSSISPSMLERALSKGVLPKNAFLLPNWVDVEANRPLSGTNSYRLKLMLHDKIVLLYSGNMGNKQGLEILAPLAKAFAPSGGMADPHVHFIFCGEGTFRPHLEKLVQDLPNVTLLPLQPNFLFNELLNAADIHLLPQRAGTASLVMPSKLATMLASGRPVIGAAEYGTQVAKALDNKRMPCGLVVPPGELAPLCESVRRLVADTGIRQELGRNAREFAVGQLSRELLLLKFERELLSLIRAPGRMTQNDRPKTRLSEPSLKKQ